MGLGTEVDGSGDMTRVTIGRCDGRSIVEDPWGCVSGLYCRSYVLGNKREVWIRRKSGMDSITIMIG